MSRAFSVADTAQLTDAVGAPATTTTPWKRFLRNPSAIGGLIVLGFMLALCFGSMPWTLESHNDQVLNRHHESPSADYWFGTDALGRSLAVRTLYGGTTSLLLGICAAGISVIIGVAWGTVAAYVGGRVDNVMMRIVDVFYSLPYILLVMLFTLAVRPILADYVSIQWATFIVLVLAIGGVSWLTMARVIRGQVLSLREQPFVEAARASGLRWHQIIARHILPNLVGPMMVYATLTVPQAILQESFLSFLGIGVQDPQATWGSLAARAIESINTVRIDWWIVFFPCAALALTLLSLNFVGDGLRDAFDPKSK
jgi:ABC-type dipeptide/oligopeptide/nickel transport system permease subunit